MVANCHLEIVISPYLSDISTDFVCQNTLRQKKLHICFVRIHQISTKFDNFWQKDGKEAKIMRVTLIFHLT